MILNQSREAKPHWNIIPGINAENLNSSELNSTPITKQISQLSTIMRSIFVLLAAAAASVVSAHNVQLAPHSRECFHEDLHKDDQMSVSFQVGDREFGHSGNLDIDFWVS